MKHALVAAAMIALAGPVHAQSADSLAQDYISLPATQQMMDEMFSADAMAAQFAASIPPEVTLSDSQLQQVGSVMSDALTGLRPKLEEVMIRQSAKMFSAEELQAMIDFYSSPAGAGVMAKMQPFMQGVMIELGPDMMGMQQQIMPQLMTILQGE